MTSVPEAPAHPDKATTRRGSAAAVAGGASVGAATGKRARIAVGPMVFAITLAAALLFLWWLLIFDHGVSSAH